MTVSLVYLSYLVAAIAAAALFAGLPRDGRTARRGALMLLLAGLAAALAYLFRQIGGDESYSITFYVVAVLAIAGAIRVVTHPKPVYSALYFISVVLNTATLLILAGAEFLGIALVIVYAGAILVTYVFVIMLSQQSPAETGPLASVLDYDRSAREPLWASLAGFMLMAVLAGMIVERQWPSFDEAKSVALAQRNTVELGRVLMTDFAVSVELAAVLLTVAMVGAIAIARKRLPQSAEFGERLPPGEAGKRVQPF